MFPPNLVEACTKQVVLHLCPFYVIVLLKTLYSLNAPASAHHHHHTFHIV